MSTIMSAEYVKSLNDLQLIVVINNSDSTVALEEFHRRYDKIILKVARGACHSINYDAGFSFEDLERDAVSEAFLAADNAIRLYNGASSLKTFLTDKINKHFLDLKRKNSLHSYREHVSVLQYNEEEESECSWVEFAEASDRFVKDRTIAEAKDEYAALLKLTTKTRHKACLRFLFEAFQKGYEKPIEYAARKLDCSRQQVYNILGDIRKNSFGKLAA